GNRVFIKPELQNRPLHGPTPYKIHTNIRRTVRPGRRGKETKWSTSGLFVESDPTLTWGHWRGKPSCWPAALIAENKRGTASRFCRESTQTTGRTIKGTVLKGEYRASVPSAPHTTRPLSQCSYVFLQQGRSPAAEGRS